MPKKVVFFLLGGLGVLIGFFVIPITRIQAASETVCFLSNTPEVHWSFRRRAGYGVGYTADDLAYGTGNDQRDCAYISELGEVGAVG